MNEKKPDFQDLFVSLYDKSLLAVQLQPVPIHAASSGASVFKHDAPEWVTEAAQEEKLMLSKQEHSDLAHLWAETPQGGRLVSPNEWLVNLHGNLYTMPDALFRHLFLSL